MPRVTGKDTQLCVNHISLLWSELGISLDELPLKLEAISHLDCLVQVCNEVLNVIVNIGFFRCRRLTCRCDERFERVFDCMGAHEEPRQMVFFEGQVYDAFELLVSLVQRAKESVVLVDGYVDAGTLNILAKKAEGVASTIWTRPKTKLTERDVETFNAQHPELTVRHTSSFHDRFLILDGTEGYLVGASLKDAGKRSFAITRIEDRSIIEAILSKLAQQS